MTEHDLSDLLERLGDRAPVSSPPTSAMLAAAGRARRRRTAWAAVGAATAVAAVTGSVAVLGQQDSPSDRVARPPVSEPTAVVAPSGTHPVGQGRIVAAVPDEWSRNALRCGTPQRDTVVVDVGVIETCATARPAGVDSIWFGGGLRMSDATDLVVDEIAGLPTRRTAIDCREGFGGSPVCSTTVYFAEDDVQIMVESSTNRSQVERMLEWIYTVDGPVPVPGYQDSNLDHQDDDAAEHYRTELAEVGLEVRKVAEKRPGIKPGYILDVDPLPGTVLEPGATVTVTEVAEPEGPADRVAVGLNSIGPGDSMEYRGLEDEQIRAGGRVVVPLGGSVWIYPRAEQIRGRIVGEVVGDALELDSRTEGPNVGRTWKAVQRGTARLTVVLAIDDRRHVIGTVTVVVD